MTSTLPFVQVDNLGTWAAYTPTLTSNGSTPSVGTGSITGRYIKTAEKIVHALVNVQFGASGVSAGTGTYFISLPVTAAADLSFYIYGSFYAFHSPTFSQGVATKNTTTSAQMIITGAGTLQGGTPWTWAANDVLVARFCYEAA